MNTTALRPRIVPGVSGVSLYECSVPGCDAWPWPTESDALLCPHTGAAKTQPAHPKQGTVLDTRGDWATVANGFGGTTTVRIETPAAPANGPTDKQKAYVRSLLAEREGVPAAEGIRSALNIAREAGKLDRRTMSQAIDALLLIARPEAKPVGDAWDVRPVQVKQAQETAAFLAVPAGKYAVGDVMVLWDKPEQGRYAGFVFVKTLTMVGDPEVEKVSFIEGRRVAIFNPNSREGVKVDDSHAGVIAAIVADFTAAAVAFGRASIHCSFCGRPLETKASRHVGYGPKCADKHGLPWGETGE